MFRYYVSYAFQGGLGNTEIHRPGPITDRNDISAVTELINKANNYQLDGLMIISFSLFGKKPVPQHNSAGGRAPSGH